ncbi:MAG: single-stranded DNA-binding protein [Methylococcales bacterium]
MATLNKVTLIGNLGADPELRYMPNGKATTAISIATTDKWKDKDSGEAKERTEWHRIVFFGSRAEVVNEYLKKGSQIYVEGKLRTRSWTDKDDTEQYVTEVIASDMQMLGKKDASANSPKSAPAPKAPPHDNFANWDDDIPF